MSKKIILVILLGIYVVSCKSQVVNDFFENSPMDDLIKRSAELRIIGVGEASHGIGDFHTLRKELFFTLVEKYQFNTVFLEAGFAECLLINNYIKDDKSKYTAKQLLDSLNYYPWRNDEFVVLIEEMRNYNLAKGEDFLMFLGADMQFKNGAIKNILGIKGSKGEEILTEEQTSFLNELLIQEEDGDKVRILTNLKGIKDRLSLTMDTAYFDDWLYKYCITALIQYFEMEYDTQYKDEGNSVRDISMAANIVNIMDANSKIKGIIIAHNGHISKGIQSKGYKGFGFYLKERYKERYLALGTEFSTGKFIAVNPRLYRKNKGKNFFQEFEVIENKSNSLGNKILDLIPEDSNSKYWYVSPSVMKKKFRAKIFATDLLGIHTKKIKKNYWKIVPSDHFDAIYFFKKVNSSSFYFLYQ